MNYFNIEEKNCPHTSLLNSIFEEEGRKNTLIIDDGNISRIADYAGHRYDLIYVAICNKTKDFSKSIKAVLNLLKTEGNLLIYFPRCLWLNEMFLESHGFSDICIYWVFPNIRNIKWFIPLKNRDTFCYSLKQVFRKAEFKSFGIRKKAEIKRNIAALFFNLGLFNFTFPKVMIAKNNAGRK